MNKDDYLTVTAAARFLGVSRMTIYRLIEAGKLHPLDLEGLYEGRRAPQRIPRHEVEALLPKP